MKSGHGKQSQEEILSMKDTRKLNILMCAATVLIGALGAIALELASSRIFLATGVLAVVSLAYLALALQLVVSISRIISLTRRIKTCSHTQNT